MRQAAVQALAPLVSSEPPSATPLTAKLNDERLRRPAGRSPGAGRTGEQEAAVRQAILDKLTDERYDVRAGGSRGAGRAGEQGARRAPAAILAKPHR